jgi:hypothetical protein
MHENSTSSNSKSNLKNKQLSTQQLAYIEIFMEND